MNPVARCRTLVTDDGESAIAFTIVDWLDRHFSANAAAADELTPGAQPCAGNCLHAIARDIHPINNMRVALPDR